MVADAATTFGAMALGLSLQQLVFNSLRQRIKVKPLRNALTLIVGIVFMLIFSAAAGSLADDGWAFVSSAVVLLLHLFYFETSRGIAEANAQVGR